jgi:transcriptional regulator with XRE-family HTH domain
MRARRLELSLTLNEVARRAGLSMQYIANLERDRRNPTVGALSKIAEALEMPTASLLREDKADESGAEELMLGSLPKSLLAFSRTSQFKAKVWRFAQLTGTPVDEMRHRVLVGMTSAPRRNRGEPATEDWMRLLDAYDLIIRG